MVLAGQFSGGSNENLSITELWRGFIASYPLVSAVNPQCYHALVNQETYRGQPLDSELIESQFLRTGFWLPPSDPFLGKQSLSLDSEPLAE